MTDDEIEKLPGLTWTGDYWKIEDADLHPLVRTIIAQQAALAEPSDLKQSKLSFYIDRGEDGLVYLSVLRHRPDALPEIVHSEQLILPQSELQAALAEPSSEPVAFDATIDDDNALALLRDMVVQEDGDLTPIRMLVGGGHSGYGLYIAAAEYQQEGAILLLPMTPEHPPVPEPQEWIDMVVVNLMREGVDKHKARELAAHFAAIRSKK